MACSQVRTTKIKGIVNDARGVAWWGYGSSKPTPMDTETSLTHLELTGEGSFVF